MLRSSYECPMLREDSGPNRDFLAYLFCDQGIAMQFLKDMGLLRSKVQCNTCGRDMTWSAEPGIPAGFRWRCRKKVAGVKRFSPSTKFYSSRMTLCTALMSSATSRLPPNTVPDASCTGSHLKSRIVKSPHNKQWLSVLPKQRVGEGQETGTDGCTIVHAKHTPVY